MAHYGLIYIIRNNVHPPNVYKVGMTRRSLEERIAELNAETSNPGKFEALAQFPVNNVEAAEAECHQNLSDFYFKKEFFKAELSEIIEIVRPTTSKYAPNEKISDAARTKNYENGDRYVGEFEGDLRHGDGTCYYANGDKYTGSWEDDLQHGHGTYTASNKDEYLGNWQNGQKQGIGSEIGIDEEFYINKGVGLYIGGWKLNKRHGNCFVFNRFSGHDNILPWFGSFSKGEPKGDFNYWCVVGSTDDILIVEKFNSEHPSLLIPQHTSLNSEITPSNPPPWMPLFEERQLLRWIRDAFSFEELAKMNDKENQIEVFKKLEIIEEKYKEELKERYYKTKIRK